MNFFKRKFHSDRTIRYEKQINKGTIRVTKRENSGRWAVMRWRFTELRLQMRDDRYLLITGGLFIGLTLVMGRISSYYSDFCQIELLGHSVATALLLTLGYILIGLFFLLALLFFAFIRTESKLKQLRNWRVDSYKSSQWYIVEKRSSKCFSNVQRLCYKAILVIIVGISASYMVAFAIQIHNFFSEHSYSISATNSAWITDCKVNQ